MKPVTGTTTDSERTPSPDSVPKGRLRAGYAVFGALVSIKIVEYLIATAVRTGDWPYLTALALISAGLIVYYFKHIYQLWGRGKHDE